MINSGKESSGSLHAGRVERQSGDRSRTRVCRQRTILLCRMQLFSGWKLYRTICRKRFSRQIQIDYSIQIAKKSQLRANDMAQNDAEIGGIIFVFYHLKLKLSVGIFYV